jgi:hypothetical protein
MFGGNTPTYLGAGQPTSEDDGALIGDGTLVYRTPPSKAAATTPSGPHGGAAANGSGPATGNGRGAAVGNDGDRGPPLVVASQAEGTP